MIGMDIKQMVSMMDSGKGTCVCMYVCMYTLYSYIVIGMDIEQMVSMMDSGKGGFNREGGFNRCVSYR
jgi:hypothetical protein